MIIHFRFSINARAALAALAHPGHVLNVRSRGFPRLPPCSDANCFAKTEECGHFPGRGVPPYPGYRTVQNSSPDKALRAAIREKRIGL
ncbi:hypothetical protein V9W40_30180, partial [Klebsiella pneumoniae]|uniref:hypothetical protein n=1 Tax=Klebsiella pneumoniae TaxID=573 RepID=UPI00307D5FF3